MNKELYETVITYIDVQFGDGDYIEPGDKQACAEMIVEALEKAGYRKANEFREPIYTVIKVPLRETGLRPVGENVYHVLYECPVCKGAQSATVTGKNDGHAIERFKETLMNNYCPNCGARLKEVDE